MTDPIYTDSGAVNHFGVLVDYLSDYPEDQREALAERYGAPGSGADQIGRTWFQSPEAFVETVESITEGTSAEEALRELVYEHDAPLEVDWMSSVARQRLIEAGLLNDLVTSPFRERDVEFPGALAALLARKLEDTRPSLAILLGTSDRDHLERLAAEYDLADTGSRAELVLRLMDFFAGPNAPDAVLERVPNPDWIGSVVMVLELGGVCYWQEVFGYESTEGEGDAGDVVPLMREEERTEEKRMAETLLEVGLIYRFEAVDSPYDMVAVPEELWKPIWGVGRGWLVEWTRGAFRELRDQGTSRRSDREVPHLQAVGKWLVCEAATGQLTLDDGAVPPEILRSLGAKTEFDDWSLEAYFELLFELSILRRGLDDFVTLGAEYEKLLEMDRGDFARDVLYEWCGGFIGTTFEDRLPKAFGLDESWREQALEILRARREFTPQWMTFEGVEQERTGAGCLRETADNSPELLARELNIVNGYVWSAKMLWLDLLSLLDAGRAYPLEVCVELEQMAASICLFSQLGQLLDDPREYFYLPVQRASFLTDPFHTSEFERWIRGVVDELLEPLRLAERDGDTVFFESLDVRIESPPGWSDEDRGRLLGEILGHEEFQFEVPMGRGRPLEPVEASEPEIEVVEESGGPRKVPIDRPVDAILEAAHGREVERFTGEHLVFAPSVVEEGDGGG